MYERGGGHNLPFPFSLSGRGLYAIALGEGFVKDTGHIRSQSHIALLGKGVAHRKAILMPEIPVAAFGGIIVVAAGGVKGIAEAAALGKAVRRIEPNAPLLSQGFVVLERRAVGEGLPVSVVGKGPYIGPSHIIKGRVFLAVRPAGAVIQVGGQVQAPSFLSANIAEGPVGRYPGALGRGQAVREPLRTVDFQLLPKGFRAAGSRSVGPGIIEGRAHVEPEFSFLFQEFQVGAHVMFEAPSAILPGRDQVSAVLIGGALRTGTRLRIPVFIIGPEGGFHVLDAGGVGVEAQLGGRGKAPVQEGGLQGLQIQVVPFYADHDGALGGLHVLPVGKEGELVFLRIGRYQGVPAVQQAAVVTQGLVFLLGNQRGARIHAHVAEPSFFVFFLEGHVQHLFPLGVLHARSPGAFGLAVYHADFVHDGGRQVVEGCGLVVEEEGAASQRKLVNLLPVELHLAVFGYLHARHPLDQVLEHVVGAHAEGRGREFHGILLHHHGVAHVRNHRRLQELLVLLQFDGAHIHLTFPEIARLHKRLVAHHLHMQHIIAQGHIFQLGGTFVVRKGKVGNGGVLGRNHIERGVGDGLVGERVHHRGLDGGQAVHHHIVVEDDNLRPGLEGQQQHNGGSKDFFHGDVRFIFSQSAAPAWRPPGCRWR